MLSFSNKIKNSLIFLSVISTVFFIRQSNKIGFNNLISKQFRQLDIQKLKPTYCSSTTGYVTITQSQLDQKSQVNDNLQKIRGSENKLMSSIKNNDYTGYGMSIIPFAAPWAALAIISLIGWGCYCICCCCDSFCPPSKCCRRNLDKKPYTKTELCCPNFGLIFIGAAILAISITAFVFNSNLDQGLMDFRCSIVTVVDDLIFGVTSNNATWIGVSNVSPKLQVISQQVSSASSQFTSSFQNTSWLDTGISTLNSDVTKIYTNNQNQQVNSPNPTSGGVTKVDSYFIKNQLGPQTQENTMTNILNKEMQIKTQAFVTIINSLKTASNTVSSQTNTITSALASGQTLINSYTSQVSDFQNTLKNFLSSSDSIFVNIKNGFYGYWAAVIFSAVLSILGSIVIQCLKLQNCRILLHVSWCLACLLMLIGFILATIMIPLNIAIFDFCDIFNSMISIESQLNAYNNLIPSDVTSKLNTCLFGDGNIASAFNIDQQLSQVYTLKNSFDSFTNSTTPGSSGYIDINSTATTITYWLQQMNSYKIGNTTDSVATNDDSAWVSISNLNKNTNSGASGSTQSSCQSQTQDTWTFYSGLCSQTVISSSQVSNNLGKPSCLEIGSFQSTDVATRYSSAPSGCPTVTTSITSYFNALKSYDDSRRTVFSNIIQDLNTLNTDNNNLINQLVSFSQNLVDLKNSVSTLLDQIGNPQTGLQNSFNCKFIGNNLKNVYNTVCISFLIPFFLMMIFMTVASILMLINSCLAYTSGMRHSNEPQFVSKKQITNLNANYQQTELQPLKV